MKSNKRDSIMISSLPVLHVELQGGRNATLVCPGCHTWQTARGGLILVHAQDGNKKTRGNIDRCPGSGQHLTFDMTESQHAKARAAEVRARRRQVADQSASVTAARLRRPTVVRALVYPPVAPAVWLVKAPRIPKPAQLGRWAGQEISATALDYANMAIDQFTDGHGAAAARAKTAGRLAREVRQRAYTAPHRGAAEVKVTLGFVEKVALLADMDDLDGRIVRKAHRLATA